MNGTTWAAERFLPTVALQWQIAGTGDLIATGITTSSGKTAAPVSAPSG
jgi:hypothetical protein